jgi:Cu/Ag efflux protein CusF
MRKHTLLIAVLLSLFVVGSAFAEAPKHSHAAASLTVSGTIVSSNSSQLVLKSSVKGKMEEETFAVNPQTKINGTLKEGEKATVQFKNDNNQKIATVISVHKLMAQKKK